MAGNADYFNSLRKPEPPPSQPFGQPTRVRSVPSASSGSPNLNPIQFKAPSNLGVAGPRSTVTPGKPGPGMPQTHKFPAQVQGPAVNKVASGQVYPKQVNPRSAPPRAANQLPAMPAKQSRFTKIKKAEVRFRHPLGTQHNGKLHAVLREMVK